MHLIPPAPFSPRRWLHNPQESWGHTGNPWQQAGTADDCQQVSGKPWRLSIMNLDAPFWVPAFINEFSGGMVLPQLRKRP